jgi:hypothetical protein
MSILNKTINIFDLYKHICGESEVPPIYNFWSCVAGISATLSDHCYFDLIPGIPIKPNLFIGFIGPGSVGKGVAMSNIAKLVQESVDLNVYRGKLTAPFLVDKLGKPYEDEHGNKHLANPLLWCLMDELKNDVGSNKTLCEDFISLMTEIYTGSHYPIQTGTRMHGEIVIDKSCLNWFFGSTKNWLRQVLSKDIFESGFIARCCFVEAEYDFGKRIFRPKLPSDYEFIYNHLQSRFYAMHEHYKGPFELSEEGEAKLIHWYENRSTPTDKMLHSVWYRQKEMVIRFAMIQCVADGGEMLINKQHVKKAIAMANQRLMFAEKLLEAASESFESRITNEVATLLRDRSVMKHCDLLKHLNSRRGLTRSKVIPALADLIERNLITRTRSPTGGVVYLWGSKNG